MKSLSKEFFEQKRQTIGFFAVKSELSAVNKFNWAEKSALSLSSKKSDIKDNKKTEIGVLSK